MDDGSRFRIGGWTVTPGLNLLEHTSGSVKIESRPMDVLVCLANHAPEAVSVEELLREVWHGRVVSDNSIYLVISQLRNVLGEAAPDAIETIPKRGYRLAVPVLFLPARSSFREQSKFQSALPARRHLAATLAVTVVLIATAAIYVSPWSPLRSGGQLEPWTIAVLPFVNMSDDPDNEYFSDGLSEEILRLLAKIPNLKVIGRTSSFSFKGKNIDLREIGQALGVKTLLEGSVRKSGDQVRITAQLINVSDGSHIWSASYERTITDIFSVQDDVAAAIIDALQIQVGTNPTRGRPTENSKAYALFLRAKASLNVFDYGEVEEILLEVVKLDPNFAEAYELLSFNYWHQTGDWIKADEGRKLIHEAAARALAIDSDLILAQALYQAADIENYSILKEIEAFERVVREQRSNPEALNALAFVLLKMGYFREALSTAVRYVDLDPFSLAANWRLSDALYAAGRTSEAVAVLEVIDQLDPRGEDWMFAVLNLLEEQDEIAIPGFEAYLQRHDFLQHEFPDSSWVRDLVTGARDPATGQAYLDRRVPQILDSVPEEYAFGWQLMLTEFYLYLGFLDRYFELILASDLSAQAWTDAASLVWVGTKFRRLGFTAHPKYLEVAESIGIIDVWEQRGPPDFCEKVGQEWACE